MDLAALVTLPGLLLLLVGGSLSCFLLFIFYRFFWVPYSWICYFRRKGIPGEPFVPIFGQLPDIARVQKESPNDFWAYENSLIRKHGPVLYYCKGPEFRLCFHDAEALKQLYTKYPSSNKLPVAKQVSDISLASKGILFCDYADWKRQRRRYNVAFQHSNLESMFERMRDICNEAVSSWENTSDDLDIAIEFGKVTLEMVVFAAFGERNSKSPEMMQTSKKIRIVMNILQDVFRSGLAFLPGANFFLSRFNSHVKEYHTAGKQFLQTLIKKRLPENCLARVLKEHAAERPDEALANALTLLQAGHETTASTMCFMMYLLHKNPAWWDAVRKEVMAVCGTTHSPSKTQAWSKLPLCSAVVNETLRLFPSIPQLSRIASEPMQIQCQGRTVLLPVGTPVIASIVAGHRDPLIWDNPNCFDPNHFLKADVPDVFVPFSAGGRNCMGRYFAILELRLVLATLAQRVHVTFAPDYELHPLSNGLTIRSRDAMNVRVRKFTEEEVEHWNTLSISSNEKDRLQQAKDIQVGAPLWETCTTEIRTTNKQQTHSQRKFVVEIAPRSRSYFGIRTPWMLRVGVLLLYSEVVRRGAILLFVDNTDEGMQRHMLIGLGVFTVVYCLETWFALALHWISMEGVHMLHMYEHHLTVSGIGIALCLQILLDSDRQNRFIFDICHVPLRIGFFAQLCEVCATTRTFLPNPDHIVCKLIQRSIGFVLMGTLSYCILRSCTLYAYETIWQHSAFKWTEATAILTAAYLASLVLPYYVFRHARALHFLLFKSKL